MPDLQRKGGHLMAWGRKKSRSGGVAECPVCRDRGGHWARNPSTGAVRPVNCAMCGLPPRGNPPS